MKTRKVTLKLYWEDGVTIEQRYFETKGKALDYARQHCSGLDYVIEPT